MVNELTTLKNLFIFIKITKKNILGDNLNLFTLIQIFPRNFLLFEKDIIIWLIKYNLLLNLGRV